MDPVCLGIDKNLHSKVLPLSERVAGTCNSAWIFGESCAIWLKVFLESVLPKLLTSTEEELSDKDLGDDRSAEEDGI